MTLIVRLLRYNDLTSSIFGILCNVLLLYLIFTVKKTKMENINKKLLPNCLLDLFLSITTLFAGIVSNFVFWPKNGSTRRGRAPETKAWSEKQPCSEPHVFFYFQQVTVINGVCYLIVGSHMHVFGFQAASFIMCIYGSSLILSIQALPVPFYIRYLVICRWVEATVHVPG